MRARVGMVARLPFAALALLPATAALAQAQIGAPSATSTSGGAGAERKSVTLTANARYDSNVPRLNDDVVDVRGLEREDFRLSPAVQLDFAHNLGRQQVGVRSYLGYDFYVRNTQLNRERLSVEPFAYLDLPVCDLAIEGLASRQQSDLGQLVYVGLDPTIGAVNTETRKRIVGRLVCGESYGLRPTFEVERGSGDNSNPLRQIADYRTTRIQPGLGYSSPSLGEISVFAFKTDTDLPNQLQLGGNTGGYTMRGYGVQYRRNLGTRLNFDGSLSSVDVTPFGSGTSRSGLNASISLTLLASEQLQFVAFANRNFTSTLTSLSTYELAQGYGLTANYAVNDRLRLRLGGQVAPREFFYTVVTPGPFIGEQTQYDIFAGATYSLNQRVRLSLDGGYQRRDADVDNFDYESFFAGLGVSITL